MIDIIGKMRTDNMYETFTMNIASNGELAGADKVDEQIGHW
jgi:hypothetical protein